MVRARSYTERMLVVVAPDAFGGTLSASGAAEAMAEGWRRRRPDDDIRCVPMADGGDGTLAVVEAAVAGSRRHSVEVADARGLATTASWLELPDGRALIESALACGLHRLPTQRRNPRLATTYGVGQLIAAAVAAGVTEIIVGLGGSATVDGGAGMATALGYRLLRADGNRLKVGGEYLADLRTILAMPPLRARIVAAVDVDAVLLGNEGAVAGFAAQKGAAEQDLQVLAHALRNLADVAERDLPGGPWRDLPGAGAAGGMGWGLAAFAGAELRPGAGLIADLVGLPGVAARADVVLTGEGRLDRWSLRGKVPGCVAALARVGAATVLAVAGDEQDGAAEAFDDVALLGEHGKDEPHAAVAAAAETLAERVERRR